MPSCITISYYFEEFKLVLCCSEGTKYENYIHELVELEVSRTEKYYTILKEKGKIIGSVSHDLHHMITSAYFTAAFETIVHDMTREQAIKYVEELAVFFNDTATTEIYTLSLHDALPIFDVA